MSHPDPWLHPEQDGLGSILETSIPSDLLLCPAIPCAPIPAAARVFPKVIAVLSASGDPDFPCPHPPGVALQEDGWTDRALPTGAGLGRLEVQLSGMGGMRGWACKVVFKLNSTKTGLNSSPETSAAFHLGQACCQQCLFYRVSPVERGWDGGAGDVLAWGTLLGLGRQLRGFFFYFILFLSTERDLCQEGISGGAGSQPCAYTVGLCSMAITFPGLYNYYY